MSGFVLLKVSRKCKLVAMQLSCLMFIHRYLLPRSLSKVQMFNRPWADPHPSKRHNHKTAHHPSSREDAPVSVE